VIEYCRVFLFSGIKLVLFGQSLRTVRCSIQFIGFISHKVEGGSFLEGFLVLKKQWNVCEDKGKTLTSGLE